MESMLHHLAAAVHDRYAVEREFGGGAMAHIFLAADLRHHRKVAIKVVRPELATAIGAERFHREIEVAAALAHPHILPLHDSGEADGFLYYVMPFVEGESLRDRLARAGPLPVEDAVSIAREVADALAYAHRHGVVHRDIKPANILLSDEHALLADFGIARLVGAAEESELTGSGLAVGTPAYMSPEQAGGERTVDGRSDIYSLGCVLYEMLAGRPPFTAPTTRGVLTRHIMDPPPDVRAGRADVPPALAEAVTRALAKMPAERFATASEMVRALEAWQATAEGGAGAVAEPPAAGGPAASPARARAATPSARPAAESVRTEWLARWRAWPAGRRHGALVGLAVVLGAVGFAVAQRSTLGPESAYAVENPRGSYVALAFRGRASTPEEEELAAELVDELTFKLSGWKSVRFVPSYALPGIVWDELGQADAAVRRLADGFKVSRAARVGTLIALSVNVRADSARVAATLYDVASQDALGHTIPVAGTKTDLDALATPVALEVLNLRGESGNLTSLRAMSRSPTAHRQYREGLEALYRWRLGEAERWFRMSLAEDSTFALPYHYLALTRYWQAAEEPERLPALGPEVARLTATAALLARGLNAHQEAHLQAFRSFWNGDYQGARRTYHELLRRDSTDSWAWLLLGSVEYKDPWLVERADGRLAPRSDLNLAVRAFDATVRYSPHFQLGYGHLFEIYRRISEATVRGQCGAFQPPGPRVLLPYELQEAAEQRGFFCPLALDSIVWVAEAAVGGIQRTKAAAGIERLRREALGRIERWARYAPEEPRPEEEWAQWLLAWRSSYGASADPAEASRATREALHHASRAVALRGDTTAGDLARLASLHLAVDDLGRAAALSERALAAAAAREGEAGSLPPAAAANVMLARGRPSRALEIATPVWGEGSMAVRDPTGGRLIAYGEVEPALTRLQVYGATARGGEELLEAFRALRRVWSGPGYTERERELLRRDATEMVGPALVLDGEAMREWFAGSEDVPAVWEGLLRAEGDTGAARDALARGLEALRARPVPPSPTDYFLTGILARRAGDDSVAVRMFGRVIDWPHDVESIDVGWGLRSLSHLYRARAEEAAGDAAAARRDYERFVELWADAEPPGRPLVEEAARAAARRRGGP